MDLSSFMLKVMTSLFTIPGPAQLPCLSFPPFGLSLSALSKSGMLFHSDRTSSVRDEGLLERMGIAAIPSDALSASSPVRI